MKWVIIVRGLDATGGYSAYGPFSSPGEAEKNLEEHHYAPDRGTWYSPDGREAVVRPIADATSLN